MMFSQSHRKRKFIKSKDDIRKTEIYEKKKRYLKIGKHNKKTEYVLGEEDS